MCSLAREDSEHVPVEWNVLANLIGWEILPRVSDERIDWAIGLIAGTLPVQTIMLAFVANQLLRKLFCDVSWRTFKILFLCLDQVAARTHGGEFVPTYAPEYDLFLACRGIEIPGAVIFQQGNRKRPVFGSDHQSYRSIRLGHKAMHFLIFDHEAYASIGVFHAIANREAALTFKDESGAAVPASAGIPIQVIRNCPDYYHPFAPGAKLTNASGDVIKLTPGQTWVELPQTGYELTKTP